VLDFLAFEFELPERVGAGDAGDVDRPAGLLAELRLFAGSALVYRDRDFPVVDLALALSKWLEHVEQTGAPFGYGRPSAALPALFEFFRGAEGWHVRSIQQEFASPAVFTLEQVVAEASRFVAAVQSAEVAAIGAVGERAGALRRE
jgi:hypothetical protein